MEHLVVELDASTYEHVRTCAARAGAPSPAAYLAKLARHDALRAEAEKMAAWYAEHEGYADHPVLEAETALAEAH